MDTVVCVWEDNLTDIKKIINRIKYDYKLDHEFPLEAENLFHEKFDKYYEDGKQYLSFFYSCLINKAKNVYRKRVAESKLITSYKTADGTVVDAIDSLHIASCYNQMTMLEEMHLDQIYKELEEKLEWYEFFTFTHLVDGYTKKDIKDSLGINELILVEIHNNIKKELRRFYE